MGIIFSRPSAAAHVLPVTPVLESWEKAGHPDQQRLRADLDQIETLAGAWFPLADGHLALELIVSLPDSAALDSGGRDLDNYLLPIARRIGAQRLDAAFSRKRHAAASTITLAAATQAASSPGEPQLSVRVTRPSASSAWKQQIHNACRDVCSSPLAPGPMRRCIRLGASSRRNWSALWKPAIDALGAVLGTQDPARPFRPDDDRIVDLALHRTVDDALHDDVDIDAWWSPVPGS